MDDLAEKKTLIKPNLKKTSYIFIKLEANFCVTPAVKKMKKKLHSSDDFFTSSEHLLIRSDMKEISFEIHCFNWEENLSWITCVQMETLTSLSL